MIGPAFERHDYLDRQRRFAEQLGSAGLDGALVVSRGGSTFDRYAQVLYLTGHYQHYSYLPDAPGLFSGRAHTALVVSSKGATVLCLSVPEVEAHEIAAGEIRHSSDFTQTIAGALASLGLERGRVGLAGADVLPVRYWRELGDRVPAVDWIECDEILDRKRRIKSPAEIAVVREAAAIHRRATTALIARVAEGRTEADLVAALAASAIAEGCGVYFAAVSSGDATRRWTSAPLPGFSTRVLREGELLRFDTAIVHRGYLSDFGRSLVVGRPSEGQQRLLDTLHQGLDAMLGAIEPGISVRQAVGVGEAALTRLGVVSAEPRAGQIASNFPVHWGHGLGLGWERPWLTESEDMTIQPGMVLAVERALTLPGVGTAAAEQNILVGEAGIEILTAGPEGRWS